jgi:hypothetical protein
MGGLIERLGDGLGNIMPPPRRFATGGLALTEAGAGGGGQLILNISGSFAPRGERFVVDELERAARHQALTSGGTKPSWHRG